MIEGDIENNEYITNAMEAIEKYWHASILMHFYIHILINYFIINNNVFLLQMSAQPAPSPLDVSSTSHNHKDRRTPSPLPTRLEDQAVIHMYWYIYIIFIYNGVHRELYLNT